MADEIEIVAYDPRWPLGFAVLANRVRQAVPGHIIAAIEHVGSTSVPGMAAKPVIDMDVVVFGLGDLTSAIEGLATVGYVHQGSNGIAGREAFLWPPGEPRHHLYVCPVDSAELRRHLAFRDYLRAHTDEAALYGMLKRRLAELYRSDRLAYNNGKTEYVEAILRRESQ